MFAGSLARSRVEKCCLKSQLCFFKSSIDPTEFGWGSLQAPRKSKEQQLWVVAAVITTA
jgi:hypothetical protein